MTATFSYRRCSVFPAAASLGAQSSSRRSANESGGNHAQAQPTADRRRQCRVRDAKTLTLAEAEAIALKNNPQISVARLEALVAQQNVRVVRSAFFPTATLNITAVGARPGQPDLRRGIE